MDGQAVAVDVVLEKCRAVGRADVTEPAPVGRDKKGDGTGLRVTVPTLIFRRTGFGGSGTETLSLVRYVSAAFCAAKAGTRSLQLEKRPPRRGRT